MLKPEFYPHPVTQDIELVQTHVSFVLLTGEFVYKLKKPVDFGFLDYSTLEKRRHFCNEELRMNQRGAPGIYLNVLRIFQNGDRFVLGDKLAEKSPEEGEIVEYALKMKQFPPNCLFVDLLDRGELTDALMERLGSIVADYHANAPTNEEILEFGTVEQIRQAIDDNYRYTENYIGRVQTRRQFEETKAYSDRTFDRHRDWFESRVRQRKIRECHGDLHLRNIALDGDQILLFDCIEFNKPFRFVDVMYDVAFTVMDCEARGRGDLGNAFLNTYIERTGDWEGLRVLPLYLSRQAYVRAKVTSFLLDDEAVSEAEKANAAKTASEYYRLAWKYTQSHSGKILMMSGLSGSGKSTTAGEVARRLGAIQVRSDAVRKHLAGIPLDERGSDEIYTADMSRRTYDRLAELGAMLAKLGWTVILDAKYDRREWRKMVFDRAESASLPVQILHCTAPMSLLRDRLDRRTGDIADATADLLASQQAKAEGFTEAEKAKVVEIDTTGDLEEIWGDGEIVG